MIEDDFLKTNVIKFIINHIYHDNLTKYLYCGYKVIKYVLCGTVNLFISWKILTPYPVVIGFFNNKEESTCQYIGADSIILISK